MINRAKSNNLTIFFRPIVSRAVNPHISTIAPHPGIGATERCFVLPLIGR